MKSVVVGDLEISEVDSDGDIELSVDGWNYLSTWVKRDEFVKALEDLGIVPANTEQNYSFYGSVLVWARRNLYGAGEAVRVTDVRQETKEDGYCETCYSKYDVVYVDWENADGSKGSEYYYGDMEEFMRELTD